MQLHIIIKNLQFSPEINGLKKSDTHYTWFPEGEEMEDKINLKINEKKEWEEHQKPPVEGQ